LPVTFLLTRVEPSPLLLQPLIGLLYQPRMIDGDDCVAISGMNEWQGKRMYSEEICPSTALSATDPSHDLTRYRTRVAEVVGRQLTARAMAQANCLPVTLDISTCTFWLFR
jgi:hypothetical protein